MLNDRKTCGERYAYELRHIQTEFFFNLRSLLSLVRDGSVKVIKWAFNNMNLKFDCALWCVRDL